MNVIQNTRLTGNVRDDRKDRGKCFEFICKILNGLNMICSFVGIILFVAVFLGLADFLDFRSSNLVWQYAHCLVIASIIFFILECLVSYFKEDSKEKKLFLEPLKNMPQSEQSSTARKRVFLDRTANVGLGKSSVIADNLQLTKSNIEIKQGSSRENIKLPNPSSNSVNLESTKNQKGIKANTSISSNSSKNINVSKNEANVATLSPCSSSKTSQNGAPIKGGKAVTLSSNPLPEIRKHPGTPKQERNANTLPSNISSKALQHPGMFKQGENEKVSSKNVPSAIRRNSGPSKQGGSAGNSSPDFSPEIRQQSKHEVKANTQSQSQNYYDSLPRVQQQLVLHSEKSKIPPHTPVTGGFPMFPSFRNFMPTASSSYIPAPMVSTTDTTAAPWRIDKHELHVMKWTYQYKPPAEEGISCQYSWGSNIDCDQNRSFVQEFQVSRASYQYPHCATGKNSSQYNLVYNQKKMSSCAPNQPRQNGMYDSDLQRHFESMNFSD